MDACAKFCRIYVHILYAFEHNSYIWGELYNRLMCPKWDISVYTYNVRTVGQNYIRRWLREWCIYIELVHIQSVFVFDLNKAWRCTTRRKQIANGKETAKMQKDVQQQVAKNCFGCKHALPSSRVYCGKLRQYVDDVVYCPHFEPEPLEYKLYRRTWNESVDRFSTFSPPLMFFT